MNTEEHPQDAAEPPNKRAKLESTNGHAERPGARDTLREFDTSKAGALTASDVGISCFVKQDNPAFSAILKHRFLDFLVNEVAKGGKVCELQDISRPVEQTAEPPKVSFGAGESWPNNAEELLANVLSPAKIEELRKFHSKGPPVKESKKVRHRNDPVSADQRVLSDVIESKEVRRGFHQRIREVFGGIFITEAIQEGDCSFIQIVWALGNDERDRRSHPRPTSHHKFIHFHLQKRNRDSHDSVNALASALGVHARDLGVTGTKDKRAVTVQRVSLRRGNHTLGDVWQAVNGGGRGSSRGRGRGRGRGARTDGRAGTTCFDLKIGDLSYQPSGLELGDLEGNRFRLVLRDVQADGQEAVERAVLALRDSGFINYFGMQRFGNSCIGTHVVGLAILQGSFELAADLLMRPRNDDYPQAQEARQIWQDTKDADAALRVMPRNCIAERSLLSFYAKHGYGNHATAVASIAKNLRMMYVHAYQSRMWNIVVSERIRLHGADRAVPGDLVIVNRTDDGEDPVIEGDIDTHNVNVTDQAGFDDVQGVVEAPSAQRMRIFVFAPKNIISGSESHLDAIAELRKTARLPDVTTLTESDASEHSIFEVVMPLAGFLVTYPSGGLGTRYRELLIADGLDPDNLYRKQKEYSLGGVYRRILHRPQNLSWSLIRYDEPDHPLALCDEDVILGRELPKPPDDGRFLALKLDFTLKASTYATMALREMLKSETASRAHKALTQDMQARYDANMAS